MTARRANLDLTARHNDEVVRRFLLPLLLLMLPLACDDMIPSQAESDLASCRKVLLSALDADPFGPDDPECVTVIWDEGMGGLRRDGGMIRLPAAVDDAAVAGAYNKVCAIATDDHKGWVRHLPPSPGLGMWHATVWTREAESARSRAVCKLLLNVDAE